MDAPLSTRDAIVRPWRRATIVASLIAAIELVVLLVAGFALLAKPMARIVHRQAEQHAFTTVKRAAPQPKAATPVTRAPKLTRARTEVLVLNGNGRNGAAAAAAVRLRGLGYKISATGNAKRSDYASTSVMYRAGYRPEALRLARDLHVKVVGPLDGIGKRALQGGELALVLGVR